MMSAADEQQIAERAVSDLIASSRDRYEIAYEYGFTDDEAAAFAYSAIPLKRLLTLQAGGCDPATAARILL